MKISIWQQFSSNHSANFTVVGKLKSTEEAKNVEQFFRDFLEQVAEFHYYDKNAPFAPVSEYERTVAQEYDLQWEKGIDWVKDTIDKHVLRYENLVFITTASIDTWQCTEPVEQLMLKQGAEVLLQQSECGEEKFVRVSLECDAPDEATAKALAEEFTVYFQPPRIEFLIPPWEAFSSNVDFSDSTTIDLPYNLRKTGQFNEQTVRLAIQALYDYQKILLTDFPMPEDVKAAEAALLPLKDEGYQFLVDINVKTLPQICRRASISCHSSALGGIVESKDKTLRVLEVFFFAPEYGLPALIGFLETKQCQNIRYNLQTIPVGDAPSYWFF